MKNIAIIDDDETDASVLAGHLKRYFQARDIPVEVAVYHDCRAFLTRFDGRFHLVFLDIIMPNMDGVSLARQIREKDPTSKLIFVSSNPKYALDGYELNVLSFLLKPISYESLELKMNRIYPLLDSLDERKIQLKNRDDIRFLQIKDITYVEVFGHYLHFHLADGSVIVYRGSLSDAEKQIDSPFFVVCSQPNLVNINYIKEIKGNSVILLDGTVLGISRSKRKSFYAAVFDRFGNAI